MDDEVNSGSASSPEEPLRAAAPLRLPPLRAQEVEIAALHEVETVANEADDLAAQAIVAPRCATRNPVAKQDFGYATVISTAQRTVQGA